MSWCSEWIRDWLRKGDWSQIELSRLSGLDPGSISRWLNSQSNPNREAVAGLIAALPERDAADLLVAWLKDSLPGGYQHLVNIEPAHLSKSPVLREEYQADNRRMLPAGMSMELQERLLFFGKMAVENPDIRKILDVCYHAASRSNKANPDG